MKEEINIKLIALCLSKDGAAQRRLYELLFPYLNGLSRRYLFEESYLKDVLQESFIRIFKSLDQFDVQKASFKTWCAKITINCCLKSNEKNSRLKTDEWKSDLHEQINYCGVIDEMSVEEVQKWLKTMPHQYFEVFSLKVIDGYSHEEISELLNIDIALSRKRLSRARMWVKKRVANDEEIKFNFSYN